MKVRDIKLMRKGISHISMLLSCWIFLDLSLKDVIACIHIVCSMMQLYHTAWDSSTTLRQFDFLDLSLKDVIACIHIVGSMMQLYHNAWNSSTTLMQFDLEPLKRPLFASQCNDSSYLKVSSCCSYIILLLIDGKTY